MTYVYLFLASFMFGIVKQDVPYAAIEKGFNGNSAEVIVNLSKDKLLLTVAGKEGVYGHPQAVLILKDFFAKHPCTGFSYTFKGKESGDNSYAIAVMQSKGGEFRVTIHFKKIGSDFRIESLVLEKQ